MTTRANDSKRTIMTIYGTRPEAIKVAPVIKAIHNDSELESVVIATAQHREMLDQVNDVFEIAPTADLNLMRHGQTLNGLSSLVITEVDRIMDLYQPDAVLVQGDTTTVMSAAIASFNREVPVVHLEAGLRSGDLNSPYPEEGNRKLVSQIASLHLAPTERSKRNLLADGVPSSRIFVVGNTVIDALHWVVDSQHGETELFESETVTPKERILLVTTHRRENLGRNMISIGRALRQLAKSRPDLKIVWPAHRNPAVRKTIEPEIRDCPNVVMMEPLPYDEFAKLMNRSYLILTDSGGIQEEAPSLGKPVLVLRENTERQEALEAGTVKLIGTETSTIVSEVSILLDNDEAYSAMSRATNPYGDGHAAIRVVSLIKNELGS